MTEQYSNTQYTRCRNIGMAKSYACRTMILLVWHLPIMFYISYYSCD